LISTSPSESTFLDPPVERLPDAGGNGRAGRRRDHGRRRLDDHGGRRIHGDVLAVTERHHLAGLDHDALPGTQGRDRRGPVVHDEHRAGRDAIHPAVLERDHARLRIDPNDGAGLARLGRRHRRRAQQEQGRFLPLRAT
jgi:hypothetical protein